MKHSNHSNTCKTLSWVALLALLIPLTAPGTAYGQTARAQFVHASPDPALAVVDVYFDDVLQLDDFAYKTATPFLDVVAGVDILVTIADSASTSAADSIRTFAVQFEPDNAYHVVATGFLEPDAYQANPDGADTGFGLFAATGALEESTRSDNNHVERIFNAVPDGPTIDFRGTVPGVGTGVLDDIAYGAYSEYISGPPVPSSGRYRIDGSGVILYETDVDFTTHSSAVSLVVWTGTIVDRSSLEPLIFLPDGSRIEGEKVDPGTARAQFVHASPDPTLATVDVYLDYALFQDDFAYRGATSFFDVPSGAHHFAFAPPTSRSAAEALGMRQVIVSEDKAHHIIVSGVLDPAQIAPNPEGRLRGLKVFVNDRATETWHTGDSFGNRFFHAVPDAPSFDFVVEDLASGYWGVAWKHISYGEFTEYGTFSTTGDGWGHGHLTPVDEQRTYLFSTRVDFSGVFHKTVFSVITGVFNSTPGFAEMNILNILHDGSSMVTKVVTGTEDQAELPATLSLLGNYPNPFNPSTSITYELPETTEIRLVVHDALGREVTRLVDGHIQAGAHTATWNAEGDVPSGVYFVKLSTGEHTETKAAVLLR